MAVDLDEVRARLSALGQQPRASEVAEALAWLGHVVSDATVLATVDALRRDSRGAGPLEALLHEPGVTDVLVNGPDAVYVDRGGGLEPAGVRFESDEAVRRLAVKTGQTPVLYPSRRRSGGGSTTPSRSWMRGCPTGSG